MEFKNVIEGTFVSAVPKEQTFTQELVSGSEMIDSGRIIIYLVSGKYFAVQTLWSSQKWPLSLN